MAKAASRELLKHLPTEERMREIMLGLATGPDHAAAITGAAYLDYALEILLEAHFRVLDREDRQRMFDGAAGGILGPISAKIRMAYALRLISPDAYRDLQLINDIRNAFAHTLHECSFSDARIKTDCGKLHYDIPLPAFPLPPKQRYVNAIITIYTALRSGVRMLMMAKLLAEQNPYAGASPSPDE